MNSASDTPMYFTNQIGNQNYNDMINTKIIQKNLLHVVNIPKKIAIKKMLKNK